MRRKEIGQQLIVLDDVGIVVDLNSLGVIRQVVVSGVLGASSCVTHTGPDDTVETPKLGVRAPESTQGEGRRLKCGRSPGVERGNGRRGCGALRRLGLGGRCASWTSGATQGGEGQPGAQAQCGQHNGRRLQMMSRMHMRGTPESCAGKFASLASNNTSVHHRLTY